MGNAENVEIVRRGFEAFNSGDMAALGELFTDDAVWHVGGNNVLSGTKQGRDAIFAYFGELGSRTQGRFHAEVQDIVGGDSHTVSIVRTQATNGDKSVDVPTVITFVLRDGKVTEGHEYSDDTGKLDDFWS
ncbi:nuclear transport factor 2 family protein [Arthrobacter sp. fls2-241-R2A-200]|uniref:nuclear transport factor 2 family protein n=1 Tax=unclassified Arthrobacter TaxID=235627 RepID=UPI00255016D1|nr:nuclear transport factor 2 family protein [Arthrobacter sp. fls2-241-R2A-200]